MASITELRVPQITPNTHIVGLCGVNDWKYPDGVRASDPIRDGWMVSDFYLLNHLFQGSGKTQTWWSCLDPEELVSRHGEYLHGNCFRERRVVLDHSQKADRTTLHITSAEELLCQFLEYFRQLCERACKAEEPILLCAFCHGDRDTYGLEIGGEEEDGPLLSVEEISNILAVNENLKISIMMTSCFSGGWTVTPLLRSNTRASKATILTAAGPNMESESWGATASLGRTCGSIYISAVVSALEAEAREEIAGGTQITTKEFAGAITNQLVNVVDPRFGTVHDHQFEVQDEAWTDPYHKRTNLPAVPCHKLLMQLRTVPPREVTDVRLDRSASLAEIEEWEHSHSTAAHALIAASNYGGSMSAVRKAIRKKAMAYMKGFPGRDGLSENIGPHSVIKKCIEKPNLLEEDGWEYAWSLLHYRMGAMEVAERLANRLGLEAPKGPQWDKDDWLKKNDGTQLKEKVGECLRLVVENKLIPTFPGTRKYYDKPLWYLAIHLAQSGLSRADVQSRLGIAQKIVQTTVTSNVQEVKAKVTLSRKAGVWFVSLKERIRSLSPSKRLSGSYSSSSRPRLSLEGPKQGPRQDKSRPGSSRQHGEG